MAESRHSDINKIFNDMLILFYETNKSNWNVLTKDNISRILYFIVTFHNFFEKGSYTFDYYNNHFFLGTSGPELDIIDELIKNLFNQQIVIKSTHSLGFYEINPYAKTDYIEQIPNYKEKSIWFSLLINILQNYGESNIYDFIFRDPEYRKMATGNEYKEAMPLSESSATFQTLEEFTDAFNEELSKIRKNTLENSIYASLFFEYLYSKIINKEV